MSHTERKLGKIRTKNQVLDLIVRMSSITVGQVVRIFNLKSDLGVLSGLRTWLVSMRMCVQPLALPSGLRIWCCRKLQCRYSSDLALLWLWWRPAAAVLIQPLACELPYATDSALKRKYRKKILFLPTTAATATEVPRPGIKLHNRSSCCGTVD